MITFKQFLTEATDNLDNLEHEVDRYIKAGEIVRPEFSTLKYQIDRALEKLGDVVSREHTHGKGMEMVDQSKDDPGLMDLSYSVPHNANEVLSLKNKLAKTKSTGHPLYKALSAFYNQHKGIAEKLKHLKGMVKTTTEKRVEKKEKEEKEYQKKFTDSASLVEVLKQHLEAYIKRAGEMAAAQYDEEIARFAKKGFDLDKAAPQPNSRMDREDYLMAKRLRAYLTDLTEEDKGSIRKASPARKKAWIEEAETGAKNAYLAWVRKMIEKIGKAVQSAEMHGSPWTGAILTVVTKDGEKQVWNAKMIINRSKYDRLFNQFPTRRVDKKDSV
jgi:hypothetical protein